MSKNWSQKVLASASSEATSAHSCEKRRARSLISFQLSGGGCPVWRWKDWLSIPTPVSAGATVAGKARPQAPVGARLHKAGGQQPTQITLPGLFGQAGVHALVPGFQPQRRRRQGAAAVHQVPDDRVLARIDLPRLQLPS